MGKKYNLQRTPYMKERVIYGVIRKTPKKTIDTKPIITTRKRRFGIFTKQTEE